MKATSIPQVNGFPGKKDRGQAKCNPSISQASSNVGVRIVRGIFSYLVQGCFMTLFFPLQGGLGRASLVVASYMHYTSICAA